MKWELAAEESVGRRLFRVWPGNYLLSYLMEWICLTNPARRKRVDLRGSARLGSRRRGKDADLWPFPKVLEETS